MVAGSLIQMLQRYVSTTIDNLYSNVTKIKIKSSIMEIIVFSNFSGHGYHCNQYLGISVQTKIVCGYYIKHRVATAFYAYHYSST